MSDDLSEGESEGASESDSRGKQYTARRDGSPYYRDTPYTDEDKRLSELCSKTSHRLDLQRRYSNIPFAGPIELGMIFSWEPANPHAAEVIEVVELTDDKVLTRSRQRLPGDIWVSKDRFREAVVLSRFKGLPDNTGAL